MVSFSYERSRGLPVTLIPYFQHLILLMTVILIYSAVTHFLSIGQEGGISLSIFVAVLMTVVMLLPSYYGPRLLHGVRVDRSRSDGGNDVPTAPLLLGSEDDSSPDDKVDDSFREERAVTVDFISFYGRHLCMTEVMQEWRCYALMFVFTCTAGSGLFVINNVIAVAATVGQSASSFFVVVLSLANSVGRMLIGIVADKLAGRVSRIKLLAITALLMAGAQFLLALTVEELLYPCLFFVGLNFGAAFSNVSAICGDLFGAKYVGSNYGFVDLSPTIGSYVFATGLIALFYPEDNDSNDDDDDDSSCKGAHCLQDAFFVTTVACVIAAFMGFFLDAKTPISKDKE